MPAVDVHGHCVPRAFLDVLVATEPFGVRAETRDGRYLVTMPGRQALRPIGGAMLDGPRRMSWMAGQGLTHQIVGPWLDIRARWPIGHRSGRGSIPGASGNGRCLARNGRTSVQAESRPARD